MYLDTPSAVKDFILVSKRKIGEQYYCLSLTLATRSPSHGIVFWQPSNEAMHHPFPQPHSWILYCYFATINLSLAPCSVWKHKQHKHPKMYLTGNWYLKNTASTGCGIALLVYYIKIIYTHLPSPVTFGGFQCWLNLWYIFSKHNPVSFTDLIPVGLMGPWDEMMKLSYLNSQRIK